jgi:hypothetical protein
VRRVLRSSTFPPTGLLARNNFRLARYSPETTGKRQWSPNFQPASDHFGGFAAARLPSHGHLRL